MSEQEAVRRVVQEYIDACQAGSVERLRAIFHENALMTGYLAGQFLIGPPEPFFDAVRNAPPPAAGTYQAKIGAIEVTGDVASAVLNESGYLGLDFTDYFHLARIDGNWRIVSKTFTSR
jgi:hypothetical protein